MTTEKLTKIETRGRITVEMCTGIHSGTGLRMVEFRDLIADYDDAAAADGDLSRGEDGYLYGTDEQAEWYAERIDATLTWLRAKAELAYLVDDETLDEIESKLGYASDYEQTSVAELAAAKALREAASLAEDHAASDLTNA